MSDIDHVKALRLAYWANGYRPVAIWSPGARNKTGELIDKAGKVPRGPDWRAKALRNPPAAVTGSVSSLALNTGILGGYVDAVDVDVLDPALVDVVVHRIEHMLGTTPLVRIGRAPKALLVYRVSQPHAKLQTPELFLPDGTKAQVEILAEGQQFVADGVHPDTGQPYRWTGSSPADVAIGDLPLVDEEALRGMLEEVEALLRDAGAVEKEKPAEKPTPPPRPKTSTAREGDDFFRNVNSAALANIEPWARALFPKAKFQLGTGAWRVSSADLGRNLEEDIAIHPDGIRDFGEEKPCTPIDVVIDHGSAADAIAAALWLCDHLGISPEHLGWRDSKRIDDAGLAQLEARVGTPPLNGHDAQGDTTGKGAPPGRKPAAGDADWPEPADLLSPAPVPRFPTDFLPGAFGKFAESQALDLQAPLDFVAIPLLIAAATAIGKEFRMAPKGRASWTERACLWGACVGYVGDGKTPAFNAAFAPLWPLQRKWREAFEGETRAYKTEVKLAKAISRQWEKAAAAALKRGDEPPEMPEGAEPPEPPSCREMMTNDATQERIAALMMNNPRGALFYRDELSGWFSSFNQYRPGADEQFYLQCHAGGPWLQHRKNGDVTIPDVFLAVFGGLQPDVVAAALARGVHTGKPDDGLTARFSLLAWPEPVSDLQWVDTSPDHDLRDHIDGLFEKLADLDPERLVGPMPKHWTHFPPLRFMPDAQEVFRVWYLAHHDTQQTLDPEAQIKGHFAKYDGLFARLALVHHLLRYVQGETSEPATIDAVTATAVRRFIDGYLRPHAGKIYGHLSRDPGYAGAKKIGRWLIDNPRVDRFTARDISQKEWAGLTGRNENTGKNYLQAALDHLDNVVAWVRAEDVPTGPRGGRPTVAYVVNPKIRPREPPERGFRK